MATLNRMPTSQLPKFEARVQQSLQQAAGRLRWNDLAIGLFMLLGLGFGFLATMILLDRTLELSSGVRQMAWIGFVGLALFIGYRQMVRPFRRTINPRFAARQIESTSKTNRNELINYVDLQEQELSCWSAQRREQSSCGEHCGRERVTSNGIEASALARRRRGAVVRVTGLDVRAISTNAVHVVVESGN